MKKIALISVFLLLLLLFGCEQKTDDPLGPFPLTEEEIVKRFLREGWIAYNSGDFQLAYARFDSAVKLDASDPYIYVGLGFSNMQLGSEDASRFDMAKSSFGFVPTLEGGSPIKEVLDGSIFWGSVTPDSALFGLVVDPDNTPILGVLEPEVHFIPDTLNPAPEQFLEVKRITENTIVTEPTVDNDRDFYLPRPNDRFELDYSYFDGEPSRVLALALAGNSQTSQLKGKSEPEELFDAIIYAKAVLEFYNESNPLRADTIAMPNYIDSDITTRNVRLLLAQNYFYYGYLYNCMWQLWILDPTLVDYFNPESPSFERDLQEKLEELQ